jgi:hypothetical protein
MKALYQAGTLGNLHAKPFAEQLVSLLEESMSLLSSNNYATPQKNKAMSIHQAATKRMVFLLVHLSVIVNAKHVV